MAHSICKIKFWSTLWNFSHIFFFFSFLKTKAIATQQKLNYIFTQILDVHCSITYYCGKLVKKYFTTNGWISKLPFIFTINCCSVIKNNIFVQIIMWIISKTLCHLKEKYKKLYVYQVRILSLFSCSVMTNSLWPHGLQDTRLPHPSPTLRVCSNSCPLSCDSIQPSHSLSSPSPAFNLSELGSLPLSQFFASCGQGIGVSASASIFPMNIQDQLPLELTGLTSLQS